MAPGPAANSKRVLYLLITDLDSDTVKMSKWNFGNVEDKPPNLSGQFYPQLRFLLLYNIYIFPAKKLSQMRKFTQFYKYISNFLYEIN